MKNVRSCRDIKLVTTKGRRNYFVWEPNSHKTIFLRKIISNKDEKNLF